MTRLCSSCEKPLDHDGDVPKLNRCRECNLDLWQPECGEGIPKRYRLARLSDFPEDKCRVFRDFGRGGGILYGPRGFGKTYAACAVLNEMMKFPAEWKKAPQFWSWGSIVSKWRSSFGRFSEVNADRFVEELAHAGFLYVDDLGDENIDTTAGVKEMAMHLFDMRYSAGRPTFVTSNFGPMPGEGLQEKFAAKMVDRLIEPPAQFLEWKDGQNRRLRRS